MAGSNSPVPVRLKIYKGAVGSSSNGPDLKHYGRPELGFRQAAARGDDASASRVPGDLRCFWTCESHLDIQGDEADTMAR